LIGFSVSPIVSHWCVLIDNNCFSLTTDNGAIDGKIKIELTEDKNYDWWYYFGERN
jgi:hypothetical protein